MAHAHNFTNAVFCDMHNVKAHIEYTMIEKKINNYGYGDNAHLINFFVGQLRENENQLCENCMTKKNKKKFSL